MKTAPGQRWEYATGLVSELISGVQPSKEIEFQAMFGKRTVEGKALVSWGIYLKDKVYEWRPFPEDTGVVGSSWRYLKGQDKPEEV